MENSIQYFAEVSIHVFEKLQLEFMKHPTDIASLVYGVSDELQQIGLSIIRETLEEINQTLKENGLRKESWIVEKNVKKQLITSLGIVDFTKTLFTNKTSGEMVYLLDQLLELDPHERMTEDAEAKMLEETVQTSYQRGGENSSLSGGISKSAVKNKLHTLEIPRTWEKPKEKKIVDYLYIEADEDHYSLQFRERKGDLTTNEYGGKNNCLIGKLIYVHEGTEPDAPKSKRYHLKNPYYFARVCDGKDNDALWDEIYAYIEAHYDVNKIKRVYLSADGGAWIKAGIKRINGLTFVMDEFHLSKYLIRMTSHMKDSTEDAKKELIKAMKHGTKDEFTAITERLKDCLESTEGEKRIDEARDYFLNNWSAARLRLLCKDGVIGCSAEGHISHILSARMSSRPMGWSRLGASKMTELRAYYKNGGNMLELVRFQKKELPVAAGAESVVMSARQILESEHKGNRKYGKYIDAMTHSLSLQTGKKVAMQHHIWGLV